MSNPSAKSNNVTSPNFSFDRDRILQQSQNLASRGQSLASLGLNRLNGGMQRLELQQRLQETRKRVAVGVQEMELQQKLADSKQRVSEGVKQMDLNQKLAVSKEKIKSMNLEQRFDKAKRGFGGAASKFGSNLQKLNFGKLIDNMEKDQSLADDLERKNRDYVDEQRAREMMREAEAACTAAIEEHLVLYLEEHPKGTYEGWIADLHPENLHEGKLLEGMGQELDHRFYVEESDHRLLWNRNLGGGLRLEVFPRSRMWLEKQQAQQDAVDLLDQSEAIGQNNISSSIPNDVPGLMTIISSGSDHTDFFDVPVSSPAVKTIVPQVTQPANGYTSDLLDMLTPTDVAPIPEENSVPNQSEPAQTSDSSMKATPELLWFQTL
jgi:hypothetical protein